MLLELLTGISEEAVDTQKYVILKMDDLSLLKQIVRLCDCKIAFLALAAVGPRVRFFLCLALEMHQNLCGLTAVGWEPVPFLW